MIEVYCLHNSVRYSNNKGSITVEASIIVPLIILCIVASIYMGLLLYHRALVQSAADIAAEAGASAWASGISEIRKGKPDKEYFEKIRLYRQIFDADKKNRLSIIEKYALDVSSRNEILRPQDESAVAELKDYIVYRKLEVSIRKRYNIPFGNILRLFGAKGTVDINVKAVSSIDEPVELIRTTDFIIDIEKRLEERFPEIKNLGEKTRDAMNDIKGKLEEFLD